MTAPNPPGQTPAQRKANLLLANAKRIAMKEIRAEISATDRPDAFEFVAYLLDERDERIQPLTMRRLLTAIPYMGDERLRETLRDCGIDSQDRAVKRLTARQREELAFWMRSTATWVRAQREKTARQQVAA